jgi:hypothetical protein
MSRATNELKKRKPEDEAERIARLALLASALLFLAAESRRAWLAFFLASQFAGVLPAGRVLAGEPGEIIRGRARDGLQDFFASEVRAHAARLAVDGDVRAWRSRMFGSITGNVLQQKTVAIGRRLLPSEALDTLDPIDFELRHAAEFAEEITARADTSRPMSSAYIGARSELYSGSGRAVWFRADERGRARGVVFYYEARDDKGTCEPCEDAQAGSPYLPGEGVFPGEVCRGRGRCRCLRIPRDAPREFERLTKRAEKLRQAGLL